MFVAFFCMHWINPNFRLGYLKWEASVFSSLFISQSNFTFACHYAVYCTDWFFFSAVSSFLSGLSQIWTRSLTLYIWRLGHQMDVSVSHQVYQTGVEEIQFHFTWFCFLICILIDRENVSPQALFAVHSHLR